MFAKALKYARLCAKLMCNILLLIIRFELPDLQVYIEN